MSSGSIIFAGSNNYTGVTVVNGGSLVVNNGENVDLTSTVTYATGSTLTFANGTNLTTLSMSTDPFIYTSTNSITAPGTSLPPDYTPPQTNFGSGSVGL